MSDYIIEEPNETPYYTGVDYWILYSPHQRKRLKKVLYQLKETWVNVYNSLNSIFSLGIDVDCIMPRIHKIFFNEYRYKLNYYLEESIKLRRQKGYVQKKINKLKNKKAQI